MLAGTVPVPDVSEAEALHCRAVFRSEFMDVRLGALLWRLHWARYCADQSGDEARKQIEAAKSKAGSIDNETKVAIKEEYNGLAGYAGRLEEQFGLVASLAVTRKDEAFFEQVAYGLSVLNSLNDTRAWVAEAWRVALKRGGPTGPGAIAKIANQLVGKDAILTASRARDELRGLGLL